MRAISPELCFSFQTVLISHFGITESWSAVSDHVAKGTLSLVTSRPEMKANCVKVCRSGFCKTASLALAVLLRNLMCQGRKREMWRIDVSKKLC
jgi:hypothetical protein